MMRTCTKCGEDKPENQFADKGTKPDGTKRKHAQCKVCHAALQAKRKQKRKEQSGGAIRSQDVAARIVRRRAPKGRGPRRLTAIEFLESLSAELQHRAQDGFFTKEEQIVFNRAKRSIDSGLVQLYNSTEQYDKRCTMCRNRKPLEEFREISQHAISKVRRSAWCNDCHQERDEKKEKKFVKSKEGIEAYRDAIRRDHDAKRDPVPRSVDNL